MIGRWLAAALLASLAGCASPPLQPGETAWTTGRLSLRVEALGERPAQNLSAAFELRGNADSGGSGELRLISPLGTVLASARWQPGLAMARTSEGERQFSSLDELSRQTLGEALPLAALPDWLAGKPWPGALFEAQADGFVQLGWRVLTSRLAEGWISARRDAAPAVDLRVRLDSAQP